MINYSIWLTSVPFNYKPPSALSKPLLKPLYGREQTNTGDYGIHDLPVVEELKERIAYHAKLGTPISYSALVSGITFHIKGEDYLIDTRHWTGLDRRIVGDYLFQIMKDQYREQGILSTMIVFSQPSVQSTTNPEPSQIVQDWLREIGAYTGDWEKFWISELNKVIAYYKRH